VYTKIIETAGIHVVQPLDRRGGHVQKLEIQTFIGKPQEEWPLEKHTHK
jgi:hypothetical protein